LNLFRRHWNWKRNFNYRNPKRRWKSDCQNNSNFSEIAKRI